MSLELSESRLCMASPLLLCLDVRHLVLSLFRRKEERKGSNIHGVFLGAGPQVRRCLLPSLLCSSHIPLKGSFLHFYRRLHSSIRQIVIEYLPWGRHCSRGRRYSLNTVDKVLPFWRFPSSQGRYVANKIKKKMMSSKRTQLVLWRRSKMGRERGDASRVTGGKPHQKGNTEKDI